MRRWTTYMMLMPVLVVQALSSCMSDDTPNDGVEDCVDVSVAFSLSQSAQPQTRMANEVLQIESTPYRGMQDVMIIPFAVSNPANGVQKTDRPKAFFVSGLAEDNYPKSVSWFYYYNNCSFMRGTNAVLFYGRAIPSVSSTNTEMTNKAYNGTLKATYPTDMFPANISFELEQMYTGTSAPTGAQTIADYMTTIARATGWSTTTDSKLRAFYLNFTGQGNQSNALLAGSSASVTAYVNELKTEIEKLDDSDIKTAILTAIGTPSLGNYPASIGLPDGVAALRWDSEAMLNNIKGAFVPQIIATTEVAINSIARFTYPAELYYFGNSQLYTSNEEVAKSVYSSTSTETWNQVLANYPGRSPVSGNTKAVALKDPIQYGVARLKMTLEAADGKILKDSKENDITYYQATIPLTGIIIGGQHTVGYDFKPIEPEGEESTDFDLRFIYDNNVSGHISNTLVLQSHNNEKVTIILEFENKTGQSFEGKDGIIYPNTKFYLIGKLDPADKSTEIAYKDRVFTQDRVTEVKMKFDEENSLKRAYNVMPNLLSPRLEIGVQLVNKWIQTEPVYIQLD